MSNVIKKPHRYRHSDDNSRTFVNVECPYCSSNLAYVYWLEFDTVGHCPDCNDNWTEGAGAIWQL